MSAFFRTKAVILKHQQLLNQDQVVTVFSEQLGKLRIFAKGIKKITSRRLSHVQTGNLVNLGLSKHQQHYYLQDSTLISSFSQIKKSSQKINMLYSVLFLLDRILPENQPEPEVYRTILELLIVLARDKQRDLSTVVDGLNRVKEQLGYGGEYLPLSKLMSNFELIIGEKIPVISI